MDLTPKDTIKMTGLNDDLIKVIQKCAEITQVPFFIIEGLRTPEKQSRLYSQGRSTPGKIVTWTMNSRHLSGCAVDLGVLVKGEYVPGNTPAELELYNKLAEWMLEAAALLQIPLQWGITINGKLTDVDHYELSRAFYK